MPILIDIGDIERLMRRRKKSKRMTPIKPPGIAERELHQRMKTLWDRILSPASDRIQQMIRDKAGPAQIAEFMEQVLRQAEFEYGLESNDIIMKWQLAVNQHTRSAMTEALQASLGVDVKALYDDSVIADALAVGGQEAAGLIRTIPGEFLGEVARAVAQNFRGEDLPEGRSLLEQIQHIGGVSSRRARLIARDQTASLTGVLNQTRQQSIGVEEYIWRTVKDQRVVGAPGGRYPDGNSKHMDHYHRDGKVFRWDSPPSDGHPGQPIQCRCWSQPVIDINKIMRHVQAA